MAPASFASANLRVILLLAKGRADFLLILSKTKVVEGEGLGKRDIFVSLAEILSVARACNAGYLFKPNEYGCWAITEVCWRVRSHC